MLPERYCPDHGVLMEWRVEQFVADCPIETCLCVYVGGNHRFEWDQEPWRWLAVENAVTEALSWAMLEQQEKEMARILRGDPPLYVLEHLAPA